MQARRRVCGRRLRSRLLGPRQLPVHHGASASGVGERQPRHPDRRHGARGHPGSRPGRANRVSISSIKKTGQERHASARVVVLGRERVRIGPHSAQFKVAALFPMDLRTPAARSADTSWIRSAPTVHGQVPLLENLPPHNEDGADGLHVYVPWWLYKEQDAGKLALRAVTTSSSAAAARCPAWRTGAGLEWLTGGSYGTEVQGRRAPLLRLVRVLCRSRRNDPE